MASSWRSALVLLAVVGCKGRSAARDAKPQDAAPSGVLADAMPVDPWPELEGYARTEPVRVITIPTKSTQLRYDVGGPAIAGDLAVIASSQIGFIGIDWRKGTVVWTKPTGPHVAPPLVTGDGIVLIADCFAPPRVPASESLLGCIRVVTPAGADVAFLGIHARSAAVSAFQQAVGPQSVWSAGEHTVRWRRGDAAVSVDLLTGVATAADAAPPPLAFTHKGRAWTIAHEDGKIVGRGPTPWHTDNSYTALLGIVWTADGSPLVRLVNAGAFMGEPELQLFDIDATGSKHAQVARPAPGIGVLGSAASSIGDVAIAARVDTSLERDVIVGYAANAMLMWVYPLPRMPRPDPVGVAIAPSTVDEEGAVVVFHDGDTVTVLPELSAPPTAPGAARAPSEIPTP